MSTLVVGRAASHDARYVRFLQNDKKKKKGVVLLGTLYRMKRSEGKAPLPCTAGIAPMDGSREIGGKGHGQEHVCMK